MEGALQYKPHFYETAVLPKEPHTSDACKKKIVNQDIWMTLNLSWV